MIMEGIYTRIDTSINTRIQNEVIIAAAGSGKTYTLTEKILTFLKNGLKPENIVGISYTNKAANELIERLRHHLGDEVDKLQLGTFHGLSLKWLKQITGVKLSPIDGDESKDILRMFTKYVNATYTYYNKYLETDYKNSLINIIRGNNVEEIEKVFLDYFEFKKKYRLIDFPQLMRNLYEALSIPKFNDRITRDISVVLVDEAQDINLIQYDILMLMNKPIIMCGDDWQSIYSFRGGSQQFMKSFAQLPNTKISILPYNYRSAPQIVDFCMKLMKTDTGDIFEKSQEAKKQCVGKIVIEKTQNQTQTIKELLEQSQQTFTILAKTNDELQTVAKELDTFKIPYYFDCRQPNINLQQKRRYMKYINSIVEGKIYYKQILNSEIIVDYDKLKVLLTDNNEEYQKEIKRIVDTILVDNKAEITDEVELEYNNERIILSTIHSAKGLEWENVIIIGVDNNKFFAKDDENKRLLYVACSRAVRNLYIFYKEKLSNFLI